MFETDDFYPVFAPDQFTICNQFINSSTLDWILDIKKNCYSKIFLNDVVLKFVQLRVTKKDLRSSSYRQYQKKLLKQEILNKKRRVRRLKKDVLFAGNELICKLKWNDFNHACNLFLLSNDNPKTPKDVDRKFGKLSEVS